jgi:hypothetical protein
MRVALILVSFSLLLNASINENLVVVKPKSDIVGKNIQKAYANTSENVAKTGSKGKSFEMPSQRPTNQTQTVVEEDQYDYEDELLMSWMEHYDKQNSELVERGDYRVGFNGTYSNEPKSISSQTSTNDTSSSDTKSSYIQGEWLTCSINNTYKFIGETMTKELVVTCKDQNNKYKQIGISVKGENASFALKAKAVYKIDLQGRYIPLDSVKSMVRNADRSDENIATSINTKEIEKQLNLAKAEYAKAFSKSASDYIEADKAYRTQEETAYDQNGNVVTTTNTQKPDITTNLIYGTVEGTLKLVEKGAEGLTQKLDYDYLLEKNSVISIYAIDLKEEQK